MIESIICLSLAKKRKEKLKSPVIFVFFFSFQECSIFLFEKRCAEKLHKPKRKEAVTEILRASVKQLERFRHPKVIFNGKKNCLGNFGKFKWNYVSLTIWLLYQKQKKEL